jgi:hypothetical protein
MPGCLVRTWKMGMICLPSMICLVLLSHWFHILYHHSLTLQLLESHSTHFMLVASTLWGPKLSWRGGVVKQTTLLASLSPLPLSITPQIARYSLCSRTTRYQVSFQCSGYFYFLSLSIYDRSFQIFHFV